MDSAPATPTVKPAVTTATELLKAAKNPLTAPRISTSPSLRPRKRLRTISGLMRGSPPSAVTTMSSCLNSSSSTSRTAAPSVVSVALPDVEVLLDAVDLDRLEHHVDGGRAEEAAHGDDERELETASRVERRDVLETEELLPEGDVARLDRDERVEDRPHARRRDLAQRAVEREVEDLVEDETAAEPRIEAGRRHRRLDLAA